MDFTIVFLELLRRITIYHLVPALILSSTTLLLVLGIIKLFKIKRPSVRGTLFFIALLKPLFILIRGTYPVSYKIYAPIAFNLQLPDPMNFFPAHLWHTDTPLYNLEIQLINTNMRVSLIIILAVVGLFLFWRWRSYYLFCRRLSKQSSFKKDEEQALSNILTQLQEKINNRARLIITEKEYESPFSFGLRDPVLVFPSYILAHLTSQEKKAVLAHELMHIHQKDTLRQWIPVILKDLLTFSPFAHFSFKKICLEREKRVDQATAYCLNDHLSLSSALLKIAKLMTKKKTPLPMTQSFFVTQKFLKLKKALTERIKPLINFPKEKSPYLSWSKRVLIAITIVFLLYPQMFIHIRALFYMLQIL